MEEWFQIVLILWYCTCRSAGPVAPWSCTGGCGGAQVNETTHFHPGSPGAGNLNVKAAPTPPPSLCGHLHPHREHLGQPVLTCSLYDSGMKAPWCAQYRPVSRSIRHLKVLSWSAVNKPLKPRGSSLGLLLMSGGCLKVSARSVWSLAVLWTSTSLHFSDTSGPEVFLPSHSMEQRGGSRCAFLN